MSCLGPHYNPQPPREWYRFSNRSVNESYAGKIQYKGNILQYKANSANLTKKQIYGKIAKGMWTNRSTTWASQTDQISLPNIASLKRNATGFVNLTPTVYVPIQADDIFVNNQECLSPASFSTSGIVMPLRSSSVNPSYFILPLRPQETVSQGPVFPPMQIPANPIQVFVPNGGTLNCNQIVNPCTNVTIQQTSNTIQQCAPTTASDVPGPLQILCWKTNHGQQTYYPRVRRTYGTSGSKWPVGSKSIKS